MRDIVFAVLVGMGVLIGCLLIATAIAQPQAHAQLHNPYWPFTVETSIHDR